MYPDAGGCGGGGENGGRYRRPREPGRPRHIPMSYRPKPCRPICLELYRCPIVAQYPGYRAPNYCMYRAAEPYDYHHVYLCHHQFIPDHYACRCCLGYAPVVDAYGYHHRYVRPAYVDCPLSCYCEPCVRAYYASLQHHAHFCPWVYAPQGHAAEAGAAPAQQQPNRYAAARSGQGAHTAAIPNSAFRRYYPGGNPSPSNSAPAPINNGAHFPCPCRNVPVSPRGELPPETALRHAELSDGFQRRSPTGSGAGPVPYNGTRPYAP